MTETMTIDADGDDTLAPHAPAHGEVSRLTARASARAREDAVAMLSSASARGAFETFEDAHSTLMAFHAYAGPEDLAWSARAATRDDAARDDVTTQTEESTRLSREASWTRDVNVFTELAGEFIDSVREKLAEASSTSRGVDIDELALIERLASAHTRELLRAEKVERQMVVARTATLEREIRHYESLIRLRGVEKTPTVDPPPPPP
tara:strand:- start:3676 stop:4296 length:621 start_codon:yes stop_codon:yes gene_type:complete